MGHANRCHLSPSRRRAGSYQLIGGAGPAAGAMRTFFSRRKRPTHSFYCPLHAQAPRVGTDGALRPPWEPNWGPLVPRATMAARTAPEAGSCPASRQPATARHVCAQLKGTRWGSILTSASTSPDSAQAGARPPLHTGDRSAGGGPGEVGMGVGAPNPEQNGLKREGLQTGGAGVAQPQQGLHASFPASLTSHPPLSH